MILRETMKRHIWGNRQENNARGVYIRLVTILSTSCNQSIFISVVSP